MLHSSKSKRVLRRRWGTFSAIGSSLLLSACAAGSGDITTGSLAPPVEPTTALGQSSTTGTSSGSTAVSATNLAAIGQSSGAQTSPAAAAPGSTSDVIAKARQLRLSGQKAKALETLDAAEGSETTESLVKERGMLALELGKLEKAEKLLTRARDDFAPDWRVHSALGATLSARGNQQAAQIEFSKALGLAPDHPSVLNNLALSYALDGNHDQAETLLRRAAAQDKGQVRTKQNLALILGLNGNIKEATKVSKLVLPESKAQSNAAFFANRQKKSVKVSKAENKPVAAIQSARATTQ